MRSSFPHSTRGAALAALLGLAGCTDIPGGSVGDPVEPVVLPPEVSPPQIERSRTDRSEVVRVVLKDPQALPATQTDTFNQGAGVVDILWVVDNSGSMATERTRLAGSFQRFIDTLAATQTDFQVGVIATDRELGARLQGTSRVITRNTPNPAQAFLADVTFPPGRVRWVQGLAMMKRFLDAPEPGFLRPNAALAVIAVSDGDDESVGEVGYFSRVLRSAKGQGSENLVSFSTIAGDLPNGCTPPGEERLYGSKAEPASRFTEMSRRTGGVVGSVCDTSFESTLTRIAQALNTLRKSFPLTLEPDPQTLSVRVNNVPIGREAANGWTYLPESNAVTFAGTYVPPPSSRIDISYAIAP